MPSNEKPLVFVSSVIEGFAEYRQAARQGIVAAGGQPILVNEDFPSLASSSRNACLDAVDSSDYLVLIVGARGGWTAPSGKLVVEEEYDRARERKVPVLVFLQDVERDADGARLARQLSDYVRGVFRRTFETAAELRREVEQALLPVIASSPSTVVMHRNPPDPFASPYRVQQAAMLRFVLSPERGEEVVDPVTLESEEFRHQLLAIGHDRTVRLFNYEHPKSWEIVGNDLVITQSAAGGRHGKGEHVRLQLAESGALILDCNITDRAANRPAHDMSDAFVVAVEDVQTVLDLCFRFAVTLFDNLDRFQRHQRFRYNVGLSGLGYRLLVRRPARGSSTGMSMRGERSVVAYDEPRVIARSDLTSPREEIRRVLTLLERAASS